MDGRPHRRVPPHGRVGDAEVEIDHVHAPAGHTAVLAGARVIAKVPDKERLDARSEGDQPQRPCGWRRVAGNGRPPGTQRQFPQPVGREGFVIWVRVGAVDGDKVALGLGGAVGCQIQQRSGVPGLVPKRGALRNGIEDCGQIIPGFGEAAMIAAPFGQM